MCVQYVVFIGYFEDQFLLDKKKMYTIFCQHKTFANKIIDCSIQQ